MRLFTNNLDCRFRHGALLLSCVVLLHACGGVGSVKERGAATADKTPVPISASLQSDFNKALALMKKGKYEEAIPQLEAILAKNDQLPGTQINLAIAYMALDAKEKAARDSNLKKAENAILRAVEVNSRDATAQQQLGLLYRKTGRFAESRKAYERAIELQPDYSLAHYNLGILCDIYLQDLKCAIAHFEKYVSLVAEDTDQVKLWLSDLRRRAGVPEPAANTTASSEAGS